MPLRYLSKNWDSDFNKKIINYFSCKVVSNFFLLLKNWTRKDMTESLCDRSLNMISEDDPLWSFSSLNRFFFFLSFFQQIFFFELNDFLKKNFFVYVSKERKWPRTSLFLAINVYTWVHDKWKKNSWIHFIMYCFQ